jgi:hypothetical protein
VAFSLDGDQEEVLEEIKISMGQRGFLNNKKNQLSR